MARHWYQVARQRAKDLGISYTEIGIRMGGIGKSTVGHWFTGRNRAGLDVIEKIADALECTVIDLISEDSYYISDPLEREHIDRLRKIPPQYRDQVARMIEAFAASLAPPPDPPKEP